MSVFVIAEAACTWRFGDAHLLNAERSIMKAAEAGAQAWKSQWVSDPREMEVRRKVPTHTYDLLWWPTVWLETLALTCQRYGIEFLCTVFLADDVAKIAPYVQRFKVASLEANDAALRRAILRYPKPVLVSSGCLTEPQLNALPWWRVEGARILHCTAAYPCHPEEINLRLLERLDGLSDHTGNVHTGGFAVAAGAEIIEVHFRLDDTPTDNPDYKHSHPPARLAKYIQQVRLAEQMLGSGIKRMESGEQALMGHRVGV